MNQSEKRNEGNLILFTKKWHINKQNHRSCFPILHKTCAIVTIHTFPRMTDAVRDFTKTVFVTISQLKTSYRKVSLVAHPDKGGSEDAFKELNMIYTDGLLWFKTSSSAFIYPDFVDGDTHDLIVRGTPIVPTPTFMKDDFPVRWARQIVASCEMMYEYHRQPHGNFSVADLQSLIDSVCRLKAYYVAWLDIGASPKINHGHFLNSWRQILYYSTRMLDVRPVGISNAVFEELTAAFGHIKYSNVDVSNIRITGDAQLEKMFGDNAWVYVGQPPKRTLTEQELEKLVEEARAEGASEVAATSSINAEQATALTKMGKQLKELKKASETAKRSMQLKIQKGEDTIALMEKQLQEQLEHAYTQPFQDHTLRVAPYPIGFPSDITMETMGGEQTIIRKAYEFFDTINIDNCGNFCLRDAINAAYMLQHPNFTKKEIEQKVVTAMRTARKQVARKQSTKRTSEGSVKETRKNDSGYHPYLVLTRMLLRRSDLTEFCDMITTLAAREIAPCPIRIAILMLHIKEIAMGNLNINVAFSVLGLCSEEERDQYLSSLRTFTNERIMCMEVLTAKNGAQQMCSQRVMRGKEICSYHARSLRFRANPN